jgi:hypothetical protein
MIKTLVFDTKPYDCAPLQQASAGLDIQWPGAAVPDDLILFNHLSFASATAPPSLDEIQTHARSSVSRAV